MDCGRRDSCWSFRVEVPQKKEEGVEGRTSKAILHYSDSCWEPRVSLTKIVSALSVQLLVEHGADVITECGE